MKKQFLILFAFISVLTFGQVPQRFNKVVVTGDITSPKFIKTGSNADSVLLGNGSTRSVNSLKTDTVSLSNRINAKATGNGTANGANTGDETLTSIKTKLGAATSVSDGYLKYQDWSIFNSKEPAFTKKSGFNLPLGTTTGTVLEGRTFGTAANSAVGAFYSTGSTVANSTLWGGDRYTNAAFSVPSLIMTSDGSNWGYTNKSQIQTWIGLNSIATQSTSSLTTNYISKWNGSSFVNATAGTDYQLPITLTTNGTSGAATLSGNVMNVPNYGASGGVNQTQTTVNGSTSGDIVGSMPFQTGSYKKVIVTLHSLTGTATYTYPVAFSDTGSNIYVHGTPGASYAVYFDRVVFSGASSSFGCLIIEGY